MQLIREYNHQQTMNDQYVFIRKVAAATLVIILMVSGVLLLWYAFHFFLLIFGAILFAVLLRAGTNFLTSRLRLPDGPALGIVTLIYFGCLIATIALIIPRVSEQIEEMRETIPQSIDNIKDQLSQYGWGRELIEMIEDENSDLMPDQRAMVNQAPVIFSSTFSVVSNFLILLVIGIFFAVSPGLYQQGIVVLVSPQYRHRLSEVMDKLYVVLKSWLLGKFLTMLFVGVASAIGLMLLDVPMAVALGFIAFLLDFIPTIGPIVAAVPAILVAFLSGPVTALYVAILYFVIQSVESYILVPMIYKKTVSISPVITLASLVLFGILAGPLGIILATPLMAVIQIIIKEMYIKDYLEKDMPGHSDNSFEARLSS
jgi:predicted PurR-regulated permease PerM